MGNVASGISSVEGLHESREVAPNLMRAVGPLIYVIVVTNFIVSHLSSILERFNTA
jgi:hypothetical protein